MIFAQTIPDLPDPTNVINRAAEFGWAEGLIAFLVVSILVMFAIALLYLLPTARDNMKKSGVLLDVASECLPEIKQLNGSTVQRLELLKDQLTTHHNVAVTASEILKQDGHARTQHRQIILTACEGVKEFLRDHDFQANKERYIHYVDEVASAIRSMG